MGYKNLTKKSLSILSVLLLIISIFILPPAAVADPYTQDDGVYFDDFKNENFVNLEHCNLSSGVIILEEGTPTDIYDYTKKPDSLEAFDLISDVSIGNGGLGGFLTQFISPEIIGGSSFPADGYSAIASEGSSCFETEAYIRYYPMHRFRFTVDYNKDIIDHIVVAWRTGPYDELANLEKISLYMWDYGSIIQRWKHIQSFSEYNSDVLNATYRYLGDSISSKYIGPDGYVDVLAVGTPKDTGLQSFLSTDYIKLEINLTKGYFPEGYATSEVIDPDTLYGWENVFWTTSRPSDYSEVRIHILDSSENVITALDGNIEGFTTSPIDISLLDVGVYDKIILKANFSSESLVISPRLYSWGVLWQTQDGFKDGFSNDLRVDKSYGIEISGGNAVVSEFYSDWAIFGKDPTNIRSFFGELSRTGKNETYWFSSDKVDIGGGFKSPVISNGKIYVGSKEGRIYAFNLIAETDKYGFQHPYNTTSAIYQTDSSLAVGGGNVILATNKLNSNENKIIGLNASDLTDEVWRYPNDKTDDLICFSAAPTIANGRVFVTSWSGKYSNIPFLTNAYDRLNKRLDYLLGNHYKLYALEASTGEQVWDPVNLPASSFSTPAVDNGLIYVGCDNFDGPSLYAFDENSGEEVWNVSVGFVGKSSPVIGEINNEKTVFIVGRELETLTSLMGNTTLYAFNAETGKHLWNISVSVNSSIGFSILKNFLFGNNLAALSPVSSPAYHNGVLYLFTMEGMLYALDVNNKGAEIWSFDTTEDGESGGLFSSAYHCASPIVVDNIVYVINENAYIYALNTADGKIKWEFKIEDDRHHPDERPANKLYASPIISDGLILASTIEQHDFGWEGRLYCIGNYTKNQEGKLTSIPVHVQKSKWWSLFNAEYENTTENTVIFSILDEDGNKIMSGLNGSNNNITTITVDTIQLQAELKIGNSTDTDHYPVLKSWEISWNDELGKPEFIDTTYEPGQDGWINLGFEQCSIEVKDTATGSVMSGLDIDSAKFDLEYITSGGAKKTETFAAECTGEPGDTRVKVTAKIADLGIAIKNLQNITFRIKDLAGNENTSLKKQFRIDSNKPTSTILNATEFASTYNTPVTILSSGEDIVGPNDESASGIWKIALYYRPVGTTDWKEYRKVASPYSFSFENETSDKFEFTSRAIDKADNYEDLASAADMSFHFDKIKPLKPVFEDSYSFNKLPEFENIVFEDDYELETIEYKFNFQGTNEWTMIKDNVNAKTYSKNFTITQSDWDLLDEDSYYYIYFKVTDYCGNQYITEKDNEALMIKKDVTPPIGDIALDLIDYEEGGWDDGFTITADIPSDISFDHACLLVSYSDDNTNWGSWEQYGEKLSDEPYKWAFKAEKGSGYYKFKTALFDAAGNMVESPEKTISVTLFPTTLVLVLVILLLAFMMVSFFVLKKFRKKK